jgi:hypothetical protein
MTNKKDSALTVATTLAATDRLRVLTDPSGTPASKTITRDNLTLSLFGAATEGDTLVYTSGAWVATTPTYVTATQTVTLTNKRVTPRTGSTTSSATPTINTDNMDFYHLTAQAVDITSFTTNLSGTPTEWQPLFISITGTAARAIAWGASFEAGAAALPTTTVTTQRLDVAFRWNDVTSKWRCMASGSA